MRARGTATIPQDVRDRLDPAEGDQFVITVEEDRIVLTLTSVIPDDQAWFWAPEWQAKEAEADQAERHIILHTLRTFDGNKARTAKELGISRTTLYAKMRAHRITQF